MISEPPNTRTFEVIERLCSLLRGLEREEGGQVGLHPVHLQVLWFLERANRYSDTPASVADYLDVTRGTASSTIRVLREKGLVQERQDVDDRRVTRLSLTPAGRGVLQEGLPPRVFDEAIAGLGCEAETLERLLVDLLRGVQRGAGARAFGVCRTCDHFTPTSSGYRCGLTGEDLTDEDAQLLCREHTVPVPGQPAPTSPGG
ncbi:MAG: winged helix-turn-helix transcriptional regulator [Thermoleophilia bacterium]|nr:winged helix-turn-helix transcriptional regulator [Thermoleophilia bacterium]